MLILLLAALAATPQLLAVADPDCAAATALAGPGVMSVGRTDASLLLVDSPASRAALARAGLAFTPLEPAESLCIAWHSGKPLPGALLYEDSVALVPLSSFRPSSFGLRHFLLPAPLPLAAPAQFSSALPDRPDTLIQRIIGRISADSVRAHIARLCAVRTRWSPTDSCRSSERQLAAYFRSLGYDSVYLQPYPQAGDTWHNVVATKLGRRNPDRLLIIGGHMDAISECPETLAPGAEDNASGTSMAVEAARVLAQEDLDQTVIFIAFTGEEQGLYGSDHHARSLRADSAAVLAMLNFDMVAWPGGAWGVRLVGLAPTRRLCELQARMAALYTPLATSLSYRSFPSDSRSYEQQGYPATSGYEYGSIPYPNYHNSGDTLGNLDPALAADVCKMATATLVHLALAPLAPQGFRVADAGNGTSLYASWRANAEPDLAGYKLLWGTTANIYTDSIVVGRVSAHRVDGLTQGMRYHFTVTALDSAGHESGPSLEDSAAPALLPLAPAGLVAQPFRFGMALSWRASPELDVAGYNVWRTTEPGSGWRRLNSTLCPDTVWRDSGIAAESLWVWATSAVDSAGNESPKSDTVRGRPVTLDRGILLVDETRDGSGTPGSPSDAQQDAFYHALLQGYAFADWDAAADGVPGAGDFGPYSTVFWHADDYTQQLIAPSVPGLANYLEQGGRLLYCGWKPIAGITAANSYPFNFTPGSFAFDRLGIARAEQAGAADFIGATGLAGYPDIAVDSTKLLAGLHGRMPYVDCLLPGTAEPVLGYRSFSGDTFTGKPVALRRRANPGRVVVVGFPLYYMVESTAVAFARRALADLGEPYGVAERRTLDASRPTPRASIIRGVLNLPSSLTPRTAPLLLDATGRQVLALGIGPNDVSSLSPGVYFVRLASGAGPRVAAVSRVVVLR
ncbi:MAG: M28 family peptidase [bacterium]